MFAKRASLGKAKRPLLNAIHRNKTLRLDTDQNNLPVGCSTCALPLYSYTDLFRLQIVNQVKPCPCTNLFPGCWFTLYKLGLSLRVDDTKWIENNK